MLISLDAVLEVRLFRFPSFLNTRFCLFSAPTKTFSKFKVFGLGLTVLLKLPLAPLNTELAEVIEYDLLFV